MSLELSVIIPCYNEAKRLHRFHSLIQEHRHLPWEWLFVDDGSTDATPDRIRDIHRDCGDTVRLLQLPANRGKGNAVREGFAAATGDFVGYVDADLAASPLHFGPYLADRELASGNEILLGIRLKTQDGKVQRLLYRHVIGRVFQTYTSLVTGLTVYDSQCGFKLLHRSLAQSIGNQMQCDGFAFDVELILIAVNRGIRIREVPIAWTEMRESSIRLRHVIAMAVDIVSIARAHRQRQPAPL